MRTFPRAQIKVDKFLSEVLKSLISIHQIPEHTSSTLLANRHIPNFCVESRHFAWIDVQVEGKKERLYVHYDCYTWYKEPTAPVSVQSITIYDTELEYETCRQRELHAAGTKGEGISHN